MVQQMASVHDADLPTRWRLNVLKDLLGKLVCLSLFLPGSPVPPCEHEWNGLGKFLGLIVSGLAGRGCRRTAFVPNRAQSA